MFQLVDLALALALIIGLHAIQPAGTFGRQVFRCFECECRMKQQKQQESSATDAAPREVLSSSGALRMAVMHTRTTYRYLGTSS
jgi:hypothetical protein